MPKPTIDTLIDFIRGARHLVADGKKKVEINHVHGEILMAIEERLLEVKLYEEGRKHESQQPATLGQEGSEYQLSN